MNFTFVNIFYLNNVSFDADNIKSINGTYSLTIMAEDMSNCGQEILISVSVTPENAKSLDHILRNYLILALISFCARVFIFSISQNYLFQVLQFFYAFAKLQTVQLILI